MNIYQIIHVTSGKSYVGKNINKDPEWRWRRHQRRAFETRYSTYNSHFYRALRKYGVNAFYFYSLAFTDDREKLATLETEFILKLKTNDPKHGFNSTTGGESVVYNDTAKKNMSEATKKVWSNSPERKVEMSRRVSGENNNFFGVDHSGKNNGFYGKKHTPESLKRISEGRKGVIPNWTIPHSETMIKMWSIPGRKETMRRMMTDRWGTPQFRESQARIFSSQEFREKAAKGGKKAIGKRWVHNPVLLQQTSIKPENLEKYLNEGWLLGMLKKKNPNQPYIPLET